MGKLGITLAISGSIVALTLVIGMFALGAATTTAATSTMGIYGHYTVKVMDSDGNLKAYIQTDNSLTHFFRDCLFDNYFGTTLQIPPADCTFGIPAIRIGDGLDPLAVLPINPAPTSNDLDLFNPYTFSGDGLAVQTAQQGSAAGGTSVTFSNEAPGGTPITINQADLSGSATGGVATDGACTDVDVPADGAVDCEIDEVGLLDFNGVLLSHAPLVKTLVSVGDTVDVALTISLTPEVIIP